MEELPCQKDDREAAERVQALLAKPDAYDRYTLSDQDFDPWQLFPSLLGCYSAAFDDLAIDVLERIQTLREEGETLAHEMFREMLCTANLCDYGTSPRVCFPTSNFRPLLPELIERWKRYRAIMWED